MTSSTPTPPPAPPPVKGGDLIQPPQPPKNPVHIMLFNLIFGCVGYFMIGQTYKGIIALVVVLLTAIPTCGTVSGAIVVAAMIDAYMQAQQLQQGHPIAQWTFFQDHR